LATGPATAALAATAALPAAALTAAALTGTATRPAAGIAASVTATGPAASLPWAVTAGLIATAFVTASSATATSAALARRFLCLIGPILPVGHNERGPVGVHDGRQVVVQFFHVLVIGIDAGVAQRIDIAFAAVGGQVGGPAAVEQSFELENIDAFGAGRRAVQHGLLFVRVDHPVVVGVQSKQQLGGDTAHQ
jgi:hypothetical protein